ncbi:TFIIA-alpha and beta-like factor [Tiliqua scincoides]|uniref:TFIIA-alpha and beta-like factor n=1 Tax=Tiliqua scincoides TaxID=71010 RepID=UPI003461A778
MAQAAEPAAAAASSSDGSWKPSGEGQGRRRRRKPGSPKFYKSVIDDVIEGVRDVFAEEGADEQVLKELKRRWETKVMQSKATEGFFRHRHFSPQFMLHLPPGFHQTLQTSAGFPAGRGIGQFTGGTATSELGTSRPAGAILSLPSGLAYPIQIPAGVTLQMASGQLYKVNMPVVVTQAPGGGPILQNPVQQIFQQLGRQSLVPPQSTSEATQANASTLQAPNAGNLQAQKPTVGMEVNALPSATVTPEAPGSQGEAARGPVASQQPSCSLENSWNVGVETAVPVLKPSEESCTRVADEAAANSPSSGDELPRSLEQQLGPDDIIELIIMGNDLDDDALRTEDANLSFVEELDNRVQMESDLRPQKEIANDLEEIIQLDGTGDISPKTEVESPRDAEDEELVGIIDAEDLKVLEDEDGDNSTSDNQSLSSTSDTDEPSVDIIEEDPLNSGDDVSEQETPDVFDTDNIIVCQYDKVQRSKNRWKIYLKDGVMCFGGKDYVFSKAIGDAEW